jgi:hypothetical protein
MSELVNKLAVGTHPVELSLRPEKSIAVLKDCIQRQYVHVKFTDTMGGTELGLRLDPAETDLSKADLETGNGEAKFVGSLMLDYVRVRCIATVDLKTFTGHGALEIVQKANVA